MQSLLCTWTILHTALPCSIYECCGNLFLYFSPTEYKHGLFLVHSLYKRTSLKKISILFLLEGHSGPALPAGMSYTTSPLCHTTHTSSCTLLAWQGVLYGRVGGFFLLFCSSHVLYIEQRGKGMWPESQMEFQPLELPSASCQVVLKCLFLVVG